MHISCRSSNVIYCITCKTCGKQYVGQTLRIIKARIYKHLKDIDQGNKEKLLGLHFFSMKREKNDIEVHILKFIKKATRGPQGMIIRKRVEKRFIHTCTSTPNTCTPWLEPRLEDQLQAQICFQIAQTSPILDQAPHDKRNTHVNPSNQV